MMAFLTGANFIIITALTNKNSDQNINGYEINRNIIKYFILTMFLSFLLAIVRADDAEEITNCG